MLIKLYICITAWVQLNKIEQPSLRSRAHEPLLLSLRTTTTEACAPEACALRREPHA